MFTKARSVGLVMALALAAGCLATVSGRTTTTVSMRTPTFVAIEGDVWVIEDYDEPVFYTDAYYWRFGGGVWYRSQAYDGGWTRITVVPDSLRRIDRPTRYVHYVAPPEARRQVGPPTHAGYGVRETPQRRQAEPVYAPPPDRRPPAGASGAPDVDRRPPPVIGGEPSPDRGPPDTADRGHPHGHEAAADHGKPDVRPDKGKSPAGRKVGKADDKGKPGKNK